MDFKVKENFVLHKIGTRPFSKYGFILNRELSRFSDSLISRFDIRPSDSEMMAKNLSGGNQQKIILAREIESNPDVLIAFQPTRGLDVGAIEFIHAQLRAARDAGKGILLVSADLPEVLALSDRIAVMYGGRFVTVLPAAQCTAEQLGPYMTGAAV